MKKICIDRYSPKLLAQMQWARSVTWGLAPKLNQFEVARALGLIDVLWKPGERIFLKFMGGTTQQRSFTRTTAEEWLQWANLDWRWVDSGYADVRVSFATSGDFAGSWSYLGTDCRNIPANEPTMNIGWSGADVVLHEFGHALGLPHEHQSPFSGIVWNEPAVVQDLSGPPNYWDYNTIKDNVLDKYAVNQVIGTQLDPLSIMMYSIPNTWTVGDFETGWNQVLSELDKQLVGELYPFNDLVGIFRYIVQKRSDIEKLSLGALVRMGKKLGLEVGTSMGKQKVLKILTDFLVIPQNLTTFGKSDTT